MAKRKGKKPTAPDLGYIAPDLRPLAVAVELLDEDEANARHHGERDVAATARSLELFGQRKPIVVVEQKGRYRIVAGNGTTQAARQLGWSHLAVARYEDERSARAYAIADNRTAELSRWDGEQLTETLAALANEGVAIDEDLGFGAADLRRNGVDVEQLLEEASDALGDLATLLKPATDVEARTDVERLAKPGDLWLLGRHRVVCGDATDPEASARALNGDGVWVTVLDPPYELSIDRVAPLISDPTILFGQAKHLRAAPDSLWRFERVLVKRSADSHRSATVQVCHEHAFVAQLGSVKHLPEDKSATLRSVIEIEHRESAHRHEKPVAVLVDHLRHWTAPGPGAVYDPFLGSGTTLIAAHQLDRTCVGLEVSPEYVDVIIDRFKRFAPGEPVRVER